MNRKDIQLLQQIRGYPAVSILMPTHRTDPENRQDPIRLRNLITQANNRLLQEFSKRQIDPILARIEETVNAINFRFTLDGLALFANQDFGRSFHLPFPLRERVVIDQTFATRDLVRALNRTLRYWVLALSEQPTRLFEGIRDDLVEIVEGGFPMVHSGPGGASPLPGGMGVSRSAYRDEQHRQFFRQVDQAFREFHTNDPLPLAVVGVDRHLAFFNEVSGHQSSIVATVAGSHDKSPPHELARLVWPLVQENQAQERHKALDELNAAVGAQRTVSSVGEVWRLAHEGRGRLLLVEEDFHYPATVDESGRILSPAADPSAPGVMDDAVDEIVEEVLAKGGDVVFVDNGSLDRHQGIALVLRY